MATENGWAICSDDGLYVGWHMTRKEAIAEHVNAIVGTTGSGWGKLTPQQVSAWKKLRKQGDRAVKVRLSYRR